MIGKLSFILPVILILLFPRNNESIYIIVDDCKNWKVRTPFKKGPYLFFLTNEKDVRVDLAHGWIDPKDKLSTEKLTLSEIIEKKALFSSDLKFQDWDRLTSVKNTKYFILRPDDYCSEKRFVYSHQFTVYQMKIYVSRDE